MTDLKSEIVGFAERCEAATGLDRELDKAIVQSLGFKYRERQYSIGLTYGKDWDRYTAREWVRGGETLNNIPAYTASLDAALTLVPEGFDWAVHQHTLAEEASAHVYLVKEASPARTFAATPALALCAAALRARAALKEQNP